MGQDTQARRGKLSGVGQVISKETGKVKSEFNFEAETDLSEEEWRAKYPDLPWPNQSDEETKA